MLPKNKVTPEIKGFVKNKLHNRLSNEGAKNLLHITHSLGKNEKHSRVTMILLLKTATKQLNKGFEPNPSSSMFY
tara:strand:- start:255 stop:479 length:225 start_codon:yes stop_codon:yes gene_type:complete